MAAEVSEEGLRSSRLLELMKESLDEVLDGMTGRPVSLLEEILAGNCLIRELSSGEASGESSGSAIETTVGESASVSVA